MKIIKKIGVLDVLIVVGVIALFFVLRAIMLPVEAEASSETPITYTVELIGKDEAFIKNIETGKTIYDYDTGVVIGTLVNYEVKPYTEETYDEANNSIVWAPVDGLYNVYLEIEANANITDKSVSIGSYPIKMGQTVYVRTEDFASMGYVYAIDYNQQ